MAYKLIEIERFENILNFENFLKLGIDGKLVYYLLLIRIMHLIK
jgi:hypothetical protein